MPHVSHASELTPPSLPGIHAGGIGRHSASRLQARIVIEPPMQAGDLLAMFWGHRFVSARTLHTDEVTNAIDMPIPGHLLHNGVHRLHYRLLTPGYRPIRSPERQVLVKLDCPGGNGDHAQLQPVQLATRVRHHGLSLDALNHDLPCTLAPYSNMAGGDQITLCWGDLRLDLPVLAQHQVGKPIKAKIPLALIQEWGPDPHLQLSYCILDRVGNRSIWAPARQLQVFVERPRSTSINIPK